MVKKFVLIDAYSIIFRSYFAFIKNPLKNSKGENTSGIFGFLSTLEKIKKRIGSEYMCLAFDAPGETFRDALYREYKATRPPPPADLPFQVDKVKELSQHLGISCLELEGYEADDILATCAQRLKNKGEVYIVSFDKDLLQMVTDTIFVYDAYQDILYDRKKVIEKIGAPPERITEFLALTGDNVDNVPGVPGIGPKRALEILKKYPHLDTALKNDKRLVSHRDTLILSKKLVTLECNVPLTITPRDIKMKSPHMERLMPILLDLEFYSYIKEISKGISPQIETKKMTTLAGIDAGNVVGIAEKNGELYLCTTLNTVFTTPTEQAKELLNDPHITKVGYDLKAIVKRLDIQPSLFDLGIAAWLCDPNKKTHSLKEIVLQHLRTYPEITPASNAHFAFQLYPLLDAQLKEHQEEKLYHEIEEPLIYVLARMEQRGIKIDRAYLKALGKEIEDDVVMLEHKIFELAGKKFNINSPKQLSHILFEDLQLKPIKKGKTHYSTNVEVLKQLSTVHPLPEKILSFRELVKIKSTYIDPLIEAAPEGRIHTSFNQTGTATGRLSSSNPNIQNIPIRTELGRKIRKGFVADKGYSLISADYSQVELRLLAHITKDKNLCDAFRQHKDIHRHTASLIFNIAEDKVDEKKRRMAKVVNYGLIYGMSDYGLAQGLDIPQEQAVQFIQSYYDLYSAVAEWRNHAIALAEEKGYTETLFGRRRPLPDIHSGNYMVREFSKRAAINTPIQGTAADLMKLAMITVENRLRQGGFERGLLLSIHDELIFEIEKERIAEAQTIIKESMESAMNLTVPIELSIGVGTSWDEVH